MMIFHLEAERNICICHKSLELVSSKTSHEHVVDDLPSFLTRMEIIGEPSVPPDSKR
jgi:hypothetical protein